MVLLTYAFIVFKATAWSNNISEKCGSLIMVLVKGQEPFGLMAYTAVKLLMRHRAYSPCFLLRRVPMLV